MNKKYLLDTSVLISDTDCIFNFEENEILISSRVVEEINNLKTENSERGFMARESQKVFLELSKVRPLKEGVFLHEIPEESFLFEKVNDLNRNCRIARVYNNTNQELSSKFKFQENDWDLIACAVNNEAILISKDLGLIDVARDFVLAEEYKADKVKTKEIYKGYRYIQVSAEVINELHKTGLDNSKYGLFPNEFAILQNELNSKHTSVCINKRGRIIACDFDNLRINNMKVKPQGLEQQMLMYLMADKDIKCISITGASGKGKTLLSVDFAMASIKNGDYSGFLYTKSTKAVDRNEELGFYKGGVEEKLKPHVQPLYSSIEYIYKDEILKGDIKNRISVDEKVDELISSGLVSLYPLANIRGSSYYSKVVMLDEAQNVTKQMIKTLVTRVGDNSKLIVSGDYDQIDDKYLNKYNNGMVHLVEQGKDFDFVAHLSMDIDTKSKRGKLSEFGATSL